MPARSASWRRAAANRGEGLTLAVAPRRQVWLDKPLPRGHAPVVSAPYGWSTPSPRPPAPLASVPEWLRTLVRLMDGAFVVPGTGFRVGLDPLLGLVFPGAGDIAGGLASALLFVVAFRNGVPAVVMLRMLVNVGVDALVGAVPLLGDLFDAAYRANEKNLALLEAHAEPGRKPAPSDYLVVGLAVLTLLGLVLLPLVVVALIARWIFDG